MRFGITLITTLFIGATLSAQTNNKVEANNLKANNDAVETVDDSKYKAKLNGSVFNSKETTTQSIESNEASLLQELFLIEDERVRLEKDVSLSSTERTSMIAKNSSEYNLKKGEFKNYVSSKGVLNISSKEQRYYISLLKNDNEVAECKRVIELIKTSK